MDLISYALSKKYTDKTVEGLGSLKGAACTIKSTTPKDNGTEIVFEWTGTSGTVESSSIFIENGVDGIDGNGISNVEKINTIGLIDTYRITFTDGNTFDYSITNGTKGEQGVQGLKGDKGEQGEQGVQGVQGIKGEKGDDGYPFLIYKEYSDISEFNKNDFPEIGLMFMIKSDGAVSFPVYRYTGNTSTPYSFVTELTGGEGIKGDKGDKGEQGEQGIQGENGKDGTTYTPVIGTVLAGDTASVSVVVDENTSTATFNFVLPKGDKGDNGTNGVNGNDGITPHIDSATKRWFIGETDTGILAEGTNGSDGSTPYIGSNGNWFIENTDTGVKAQGKDGKSIKSITKDDNNNIIVTFSDNTTQNIGKLSVDVQADFLTSDGFGKLRYYNGHFQYYNESTSTWVDTSVTPDNVYVVNMTPQPMESISCAFNRKLGKLKLKFKEPPDTIVDGQAFCIVEKVVIRRKLGSAPTDENDGDFVLEVLRSSFGSYANEWFIDDGVVPEIGNTYYYKAFPMSTTGFYNYSDLNIASVERKGYVLYGFKIDQNESDPESRVTYLPDCDNAEYKSAYMDYDNDIFNYGDWENAWFIDGLKPCMLNYDGTVAYELDKNDYTKKVDGTDSDITNLTFAGNAMVGIPTVWVKREMIDGYEYVYICDKQLDETYHAYAHTDANGNIIDYFYFPIYEGYIHNNVLRSISGVYPTVDCTVSTEIAAAKNNNPEGENIWYTSVLADRQLINDLLVLLSKSTNSQQAYGCGCTYGNPYGGDLINTGTMNDKGLFWGNKSSSYGVKVFGIENYYANRWERVAGYIYTGSVIKVKLTYGVEDGSSIVGYNEDGTGYIEIPDSRVNGSDGSCITKGYINKYGFFPKNLNGSTTTYECDHVYYNGSGIRYIMMGSATSGDDGCGIFALAMHCNSSYTGGTTGTSPSCKPLATT